MSFCEPAIPELARTWSAPAAPKDGSSIYKYAFLALTFSDITSPPATDVANHYVTGDMKTYMDGAMNGCGDYTMTAYDVPLVQGPGQGGVAVGLVDGESVPIVSGASSPEADADPDSFRFLRLRLDVSTDGTSADDDE